MADEKVKDPRKFSKAFAAILSAESTKTGDVIARKGQQSIFGLLENIFPQVCFPRTGVIDC